METSEEISKAENVKIALEEFFTNFLLRVSLILEKTQISPEKQKKKSKKITNFQFFSFFYLLIFS